MSAPGSTVSIRFDALNNLTPVLKTMTGSMDGFKTTVTNLKGEFVKLNSGSFTGALGNMSRPFEQAGTKISEFRTKLSQIGGALSQNATSFGVATASVWGIYNAYDSLTKVQIRASAASVRVQTLTTTLHSLTERLRIAQEKGNLTQEQMAVIQERITDTQSKLNVATERSADIAQDVQEAWAGFFSTVGPQAVAAGASIIQLGSVLKGSFKDSGGFINTLKSAFTGLFPSLNRAKTESLLLGPALGGIAPKAEQATGKLAGLKNALGGIGVGGAALGAGILALGGFLVALGVDIINTQKKIADLQVELKHLEVGSTAAFENMQKQSQAFFDSMGGQIDSFLTGAGVTKVLPFGNIIENVMGTKNLEKDSADFKVNLSKTLDEVMSSATATLAGELSPSTKSNIDKGIARLRQYLIDSSKKNFASPDAFTNTIDVMKPIAAELQRNLEALPQLIAGGKVDISGLMTKQTAEVQKFAEAIVKDLGGATKAAAVPSQILNSNIDLLIQSMVQGGQVAPQMADAIKAAVTDIIKKSDDVGKNFATIGKVVGITGVGIRHMGDDIAYVTAQTDPFNVNLTKASGLMKDTKKAIDEQQKARYQEVAAVKASAAAYLGLNGIQGQSVGQLQVFNEITGKSIDALVEKGLTLRKTADAENLANQTTFDSVTTQADYIEKMINVNKVNDGSITSYIALREAIISGKEAAMDFVTQTVLGKESTDAQTNAMLEEVAVFAKIPSVLHPTVEQLNQIYAAEVQTGEGGKELAKIFTETVLPGITDVFDQIAQTAGGDKVHKALKDLFKEFDVKHFFKGERGNLEDVLVEQFHVDRFADQMNAKLKGVQLLITAGKMNDKDADIVAKGLMKMINERIAKQPELAAHIKPVEDLVQQVLDSDHPLQTLIANFAEIKKGLEESKTPLDDIDKLIAGLPGTTNAASTSVGGLASSFNSLATSSSAAATSLLKAAEASFDPSKFAPSKFAKNTFRSTDPNLSNKATGQGATPTKATLDISEATANISRLIGNFNGWLKTAQTESVAKLQITDATKNITRIIGNFGGWFNIANNSNPGIKANPAPATSSITRVIGNFNGWFSRVNGANPPIKANPAPATSSITRVIGNFQGWVNKANSANPQIKANPSPALNAIKQVQNALSGLKDKNVTVTTTHLTKENTCTNCRFGGSSLHMQHGGSFIADHEMFFKGAHIAEFNKPELVTVTPLTNPYDATDKSMKIVTEHLTKFNTRGSPGSSKQGPIHINLTVPVYLAQGLPAITKFVRQVVLEDVGMFPSS